MYQFAANQNDVFLLALIAVLVSTVAVCGSILFTRLIPRRRARRLVVVGAIFIAAVALGAAGLQGNAGVQTLVKDRIQVRTEIQQKYGLRLVSGQVDELVNGGQPLVSLSTRAAALGLRNPSECKPLQFVQRTVRVSKTVTRVVPDTYDLTLGGVMLRPAGQGADRAPTCVPPRSSSS